MATDFKETHLEEFKESAPSKFSRVELFSWVMLAVTVGVISVIWF
jgi:hypothetical protein